MQEDTDAMIEGSTSPGQSRTSGKVVRFKNAHEAYWVITAFLVQSPTYQRAPLGEVVPRLQRYIALGNYACLSEDEKLKAVLVWADVDAERFAATYTQGQPYTHQDGDKNDGVLWAAILGVDRPSLIAIANFGRKFLRGKRIFWDRHRQREPSFSKDRSR